MIRGFRKLGKPVPFVEGATESVEIPANTGLISELRHVTDYTYGITGGTGAGAVLGDAAWRLARMIELAAQGGGKVATIHRAPGHTFGVINDLFYETPTPQTDPTTITAAASNTCESEIVIPFFVPRSFTPFEALLPAPLAKPVLSLTYGNAMGLVTQPHDGTPAFSGVTTELHARTHHVSNPKGNIRRPYMQFGTFMVKSRILDVSASGEEPVELTHMQKGEELLAVIIEGLAGGVAKEQYVHSDAVVNTVELEINGVKEMQKNDFARYQALNKETYNLSAVKTGVVVLSAYEDMISSPGQVWTPQTAPVVNLEYTYSGSLQDRIVITTLAIRRGIPITANV